MSSNPQKSAKRQAGESLSKAFVSDVPELGESDVTRIHFASASVEVCPGRHFELMLEVEAEFSASRGLGWAMYLSGWDAREDSCEAIFESKLPHALSQRLALSASPLADAAAAKPNLLVRAIAALPGLGASLSALVAAAEAKELAAHARHAKKSPLRRAL